MSDTINGEIVPANNGNASAGIKAYSSIKGDDFATRLKILDAVTNSTPLSDAIGKTIKLQNIIVQPVDMADETTGVVSAQPRIVFISEDGKAFHAISTGLFLSVQSLLSILGEPANWPNAVPVKVLQEGQGTRKYFTVRLAL